MGWVPKRCCEQRFAKHSAKQTNPTLALNNHFGPRRSANRTINVPDMTRIDYSKYSEAICVRGRNPQVSWTIFTDKKCTLQNLPMDSPKRRNGLSVLLVDWPFCGKSFVGEIFSSPTDDFGGSKMRGYCRRRPDYSSNLCPPKIWSIWLFQGVFWDCSCSFSCRKGPKTPLKNHIDHILGGHRLDE